MAVAPEVVLPVFKHVAGKLVVVVAGEGAKSAEIVFSFFYGKQSVSCRSDDDVSMGIFEDSLYAWRYLVGKAIACEGVIIGVVGGKALAAAHPKTPFAVG